MTAKEWNQKYPVGTKVMYYPVAGRPEYIETETTSEAWELGHGEAVVKINRRAGGVSLKHLKIGHTGCKHEKITTQWDTCQNCGAVTGGLV